MCRNNNKFKILIRSTLTKKNKDYGKIIDYILVRKLDKPRKPYYICMFLEIEIVH